LLALVIRRDGGVPEVSILQMNMGTSLVSDLSGNLPKSNQPMRCLCQRDFEVFGPFITLEGNSQVRFSSATAALNRTPQTTVFVCFLSFVVNFNYKKKFDLRECSGHDE